MSPGVRTIPAAIAFPMAAAMPNHMPRTFRSRPVEWGRFEWTKGLVVKGACWQKDERAEQGGHHNRGSRNCKRELTRGKSSNAAEKKKAESAGKADEIPFAPFERFMDGGEMSVRQLSNQIGLGEPLLVGAAFEMDHGGERIHLVRKAEGQG